MNLRFINKISKSKFHDGKHFSPPCNLSTWNKISCMERFQ